MKCFKCTNKSNNVLLVAANDIEELERMIELADDCHVLKMIIMILLSRE